MSELKTYKFSALYEMSSGISSKPEQAGHGSPFVSFSTVFNNQFLPEILPDLMDTSDKEKEMYSIKEGDIFLTRTSETLNELGMSCVAAKDYPEASYSGFLKRLRPTQTDKTYAKFMAFYLRSKLFRKTMNNNAIMTLRASLNEQIFSYLDLILPEYEDQVKIGNLFFAFNQKIELNNKINAELEAMAKLIYDYWFVQFDFPNENGLPYKSSGGKMVWNEELKREIPEGWEVDIIGNLLAKEKLGRKIPSSDYLNSGSIPIIDQSTRFICGYSNDETSRVETKVPRIVFGDHTRILKLINFDFARGADGTQVLLSKEQRVPQHFFFHSLSKIDLSNYGYARHFKFLKETKTIIPNLRVAESFEKKVKEYYKMIWLNIKENQKLAELRDWLLPMLMNGQVRVGEQAKTSIIPLEKPLIPSMVAEEAPIYEVKNAKVQRKMLATFIINESLNDPNFGKTKFEKLLHLVEYHVLKKEFNQTYSVQAAGPYDGKFTVPFWKEVLKGKWFAIEEQGNLKRIVAGANHEKSLKDYGYLSDDDKRAITGFIGRFKGKTYKEPEIISTLFAVWNNRIIQNELITDALLKKDFLEWDEQKAKYTDRVDGALNWMREKGIVPDGWGKVIGRAKGKKK